MMIIDGHEDRFNFAFSRPTILEFPVLGLMSMKLNRPPEHAGSYGNVAEIKKDPVIFCLVLYSELDTDLGATAKSIRWSCYCS